MRISRYCKSDNFLEAEGGLIQTPFKLLKTDLDI